MGGSEIKIYELWRKYATDDVDLIRELDKIENDEKAIEERFYKELEFGTAGIRGIIGAGTARMNIYVVRKVTQAFCEYLTKNFENPSVAIGYDNRIKSDLFAKEAACVFAANGIFVNIYKEIMPVPCLSYAVRNLGCDAGIMVTASHNPAQYNGYKVYGEDGCQLREDDASQIYEISLNIDMFKDIKLMDFEQGLYKGVIKYISDDVEKAYMDCVESCLIHPEALAEPGFCVVYTPLHGAGNRVIRTMFSRMGVKSVHVVLEQENPDGNFSTCQVPNPEIKEALALGLRDCKIYKPDILIATDPDCDRIGVAVPDEAGEYVLLSGNQIGALLLEYICCQRVALGTLPKDPIAVKTIVSSEIAEKIAQKYNVKLKNVLTGFKYIGEQIGILEKLGKQDSFIFGFEESHGYLAGSYVRDKDGVIATMLVCEMAAFYKKSGMSVLKAVSDIYKEYGVCKNVIDSYVFDGVNGATKMLKIISKIREDAPKSIGGLKVLRFLDYFVGKDFDTIQNTCRSINLPKSNVIEFKLENDSSLIVRPSGTEPKIKVYYTSTGSTFSEAEKYQLKMKKEIEKYIND